MSNTSNIPTTTGRADGRTKLGSAKDADGLTNGQRRFVECYCETLNATEAAKRAGYAERTAGAQGAWLLKQPSIRQAIEQFVFDRAQLTRAEIITELRDVALANAEDYFDWSMTEDVQEILDDGTVLVRQRADVRLKPSSELSRRKKAAIKGVISKSGADGRRTVELSFHDKLAALDKLARIFDLFPRDGETRVNIGLNAPITSVSVSFADDPSPEMIEGHAREVNNDDR